MTPGEKHTAGAAEAAIKMLASDDQQAIRAWIDDRERRAREDGATRAALTGGLVIFLRALALVLPFAGVSLLGLWGAGAFDPPVCETCPEPPPCPETESVYWHAADGVGSRYATTSTRRCVAIDDVVMCAPVRAPVLPPGATP